MNQQFSIGDRVRWQARTGDPEREGTVKVILPSGMEPFVMLAYRDKFDPIKEWNICFDWKKQRFHESYIVVTDPGKRGGKPSAFRPLVKNLKLVEPKDTKQ